MKSAQRDGAGEKGIVSETRSRGQSIAAACGVAGAHYAAKRQLCAHKKIRSAF